jgi:hypothetical protein
VARDRDAAAGRSADAHQEHQCGLEVRDVEQDEVRLNHQPRRRTEAVEAGQRLQHAERRALDPRGLVVGRWGPDRAAQQLPAVHGVPERRPELGGALVEEHLADHGV